MTVSQPLAIVVRTFLLFVAATLVSCIDKPSPMESAVRSARVARLSVASSLNRAAALANRVIDIKVAYSRATGELVSLAEQRTPVIAGSGRQDVPMSIDLADCLADPQRSGDRATCPLRVFVTLRDPEVEAAVDSTDLAVIATPGESVVVTTPTIAVSPTGTGLRDATVFRFAASPGSLTSLPVTWDFGDGTSGAGDTVTHVYTRAGSFNVRARFGTGTAGASAGSTVAVGSLDGLWTTNPAATNGIVFVLAIAQQGATLSGEYFVEVAPTSTAYTGNNWVAVSALTGGVSNARTVSLNQGGECLRSMNGATISDDLNTISGFAATGNPLCAAGSTFTFTRVQQRLIRGVVVSPVTVIMPVGGTVPFTAVVDADGAADRSVGWTTGNVGIAKVTAAGAVIGVNPGTTTVIARSLADPTKLSTAVVTVGPVAPPSPPSLRIFSINQSGTGIPANLNAVRGSIDVVVSGALGSGARSVELLLAGATTGVLATFPVPSGSSPTASAIFTLSGNTTVVPNGPYALTLQVVNTDGVAVTTSTVSVIVSNP